MNDKANAAAPTNGTPSEPGGELRDGVPSTVRPHAEDYFDHVEALRRQGLKQDGMPLVETVQDYFKRLYPEHYVQIITNINRERGPEMTAHLLSTEAFPHKLQCAFIWNRSPEGHKFWKALAKREDT